MNGPRDDVAFVACLGFMSVVEEYVPEGEHSRVMRQFHDRMMAALEMYAAYSEKLHEIEPSEN